MKNLFSLLILFLLNSCTAVAPFNQTSAKSTPTQLTITGTSKPESETAEENIEYRKFSDEWIHTHQIKSTCIDFDSTNRIWSYSWELNPLSIYLEYFDGSTWNKVQTPDGFSQNSSCPHARKDGTIMFVSPRYNIPEAIFYLNNDSKSWTTVHTPVFPIPQEEVRRETWVVDTFSRIWVGLDKCPNKSSCLFRLDDNQWKEQPFPFPSIHTISADQNGGVWVGGNEETGIAHFDGNNWTIYDTKSLWEDGEVIFPPRPLSVVTSLDGSAWVIRYYNYDWIRINNKGKIERYPSKVTVDEFNIFTGFVDSQERLWFFWEHEQIGYFDYHRNLWVHFTGLPSGARMGNPSFVLSPDGELWFVLANNIKDKVGIYKYSPLEE